MADSLTLAHLLANAFRRLARRFNRKVAEIVILLFNHKRSGSLGALAGFAIAILFTRKILKSPGGKKRLQKETSPSSPSTAAFSPNEVASSCKNYEQREHAKGAGPIDEFHTPTYLALGQIVKKRLYGSKKMTCRLLRVILMESNPEELQEHATVRPSLVELLLEISNFCDIYLMERVLDDESAERAMTALERAGLFKTGGLMKKKVLFCSTEDGILSFVRQIEPEWHVDSNADILSKLSRFIRYLLHVSPTRYSFASGSNIVTSMSLELYFTEKEIA